MYESHDNNFVCHNINSFLIQQYIMKYDLLDKYILLPAEDKYPSIGDGYQRVVDSVDIEEFTADQLSFCDLYHFSDYIVIDIDSKEENGFTDGQRDKIREVIERYNIKKVYKEISVSGEGFHLITKLNKNQMETFNRKFPKKVKQEIARKVEKFTGGKNIIIYPSVDTTTGTRCELLGNTESLADIDYLNDMEFKIFCNMIKEICNICGECDKIIVPVNKKNNDKIILNTNSELKLAINGNLKRVWLMNKYVESLSDEQKEELLTRILELLNIQYEERYTGKWNIYSLLCDDGRYPDSYIYIGKNYVYYDFHFNEAYNLLAILFLKYDEYLFDIFEKLTGINIRPKKNNRIPEIVVNTPDELYDKLKEYAGKKNIMVVASTGFGKTNTIKKLSEEKKIIMFEPLQVQVEQERRIKTENIGYMCEKIKKINKNNNLIFSTYDQIKNVINYLDDRLIVIDECHTLVSDSYRNKVIRQLWNNIKDRKCIYMTATDYCVFLPNIELIIRAKSNKQNKYFKIIETKKMFDTLVGNVIKIYEKKPNLKQWIYIDSKKKLNVIKDKLIKYFDNVDIKTVTADDTDGLKDIIVEMRINDTITLSTRKLSSGFHLMNNETYIIHTIPSDINVLLQLVNRFRKDNNVLCLIYNKETEKNEKYFNRMNNYLDSLYNTVYETFKDYKFNMNENKYYHNNWYELFSKFELYPSQLIYDGYIKTISKNTNYIRAAFNEHYWKEYQKDVPMFEMDINIDDELEENYLIIYRYNKDKNIDEIENEIMEIDSRKIKDEVKLKVLKIIYQLKKYNIEIENIEELLEKGRIDIIWKMINRKKDEMLIDSEDENVVKIENKLVELIDDKEYIDTKDIKKLYINLGIKKNQLIKMLEKMGYKSKKKMINGKQIRVYMKS